MLILAQLALDLQRPTINFFAVIVHNAMPVIRLRCRGFHFRCAQIGDATWQIIGFYNARVETVAIPKAVTPGLECAVVVKLIYVQNEPGECLISTVYQSAISLEQKHTAVCVGLRSFNQLHVAIGIHGNFTEFLVRAHIAPPELVLQFCNSKIAARIFRTVAETRGFIAEFCDTSFLADQRHAAKGKPLYLETNICNLLIGLYFWIQSSIQILENLFSTLHCTCFYNE